MRALRNSKGYALAILMVVGLFNYIDRLSLSILQVPIKAEFGLSDAQLGAMTGLAFSLVYTIASVPIARIADRASRKMVITISLFIWTTMTIACGWAEGLVSLIVLRMGVALGEAGCMPATYSIISDYFPLHQRARAIATYSLVIPFGMLLGFSVSGWLVEALGWRQAFFILGVLGLFLVPLVALTLVEPVRGQADGQIVSASKVPFSTAIEILWRTPSLLYVILSIGLMTFPLNAVMVWSASYYQRTYSLPLSEVAGYLALLFGGAGAVGMYFSGVITDKLGKTDRRWYLLFPAGTSALLVPTLYWQFHVSDSAHYSFAVGVVSAMLINSYMAPLNALAQSLVPANLRALAMSIIVCSGGLFGAVMGSFCTGLLSDILASRGFGDASLGYAIIASGLVGLVGSGLLLIGARSLPRTLQELELARQP